MIFYDTNMFLSHTFSRINSGVEFLAGFFNENTQALYIIAIYKPPQMSTIFFISIESITLQTYMNTHNFHIISIESITCNNTQINHIWTNALTQQFYVGSTSLLD